MTATTMTKSSFRQAAFAALTALVFAAFGMHLAFAGDDGHRHNSEKMAGRMVKKIDRKLDLSAEQKTATREILVSFMQARHERHDAEEQSVADLWGREALSANEIQSAMERRRQSRDEMRAMFAEKLAEFHAILTPEQRAEAVKYAERAMAFGAGDDFHGKRDKRRGWMFWRN